MKPTKYKRLFFLASIAGISSLSLSTAFAGDPEVEQGKKVYEVTGACVTCHGPLGQGDGVAAAALEPKPRNFSAGEFKYDTDADGKTGTEKDLFNIVSDGAAKFGGSPLMVSYGFLSETDRKAVVKYVMSLKK